uniref:Uncharacterized protein n=1 Tax=Parascaris univalens TaxID=6257 RepID=A0A914ZEB2_PARUN
MKEAEKLDDFICCLNVEAITTICLVITLCMLACCSVFVPDELFLFVLIVVVLLAITTPTAILLKSPQMLLIFIFVTALLIGICLFLLIEFNLQNDDIIILKLSQIAINDEEMKEIRLTINIKTIKITLYFVLLYFIMQLFALCECIRYYKFIELLNEALKREDENVDWIENIYRQRMQGGRQLQLAQISANKRTMVIPSAPPIYDINASRPQPSLFPFPQSNNKSLR